MLMLLPGHQSTLEVWDREGSTIFLLNWNRKARKKVGEFAPCLEGTNLWNRHQLIELEKSSATTGGILPQTTQKGQKNGLSPMSNLKKSLDHLGSYGLLTSLTPADSNPGDLEPRRQSGTIP